MPLKILHKRSVTGSKRPTPSVMEFGELSVNYANGEPGVFLKTPNNSVIKIGPAFVGTNAPNNAPAVGGQSGNSVGEFWFDENVDALKIWDGVAWRLASLGGNQVIVATTAPTVRLDGSVLVEGDLWWECDEGGLYIWYIDSGSNQWVQINGSSGGTGGGGTVTEASLVIISETAPIQRPSSDPLEPGDIWWQSETGSIAVWYDDGNSLQWVQFNANLVGMFVEKTSDTGSAVLPSGNISQRDGSPVAGYTRWNTDLDCLEVYNGTVWECQKEVLFDVDPSNLGDLIITTGNTEIISDPLQEYNSIVVQSGGTLVISGVYTELKVTTSIVVDGTVTVEPRVYGGKRSSSFLGTGFVTALSLFNFLANVGEGVGRGDTDTQTVSNPYLPSLQPYGSGGGSGAGTTTLSASLLTPSVGGNGGSGLVFKCDTFLLGTTGVITSNGTNAGANTATGASYTSGGCGGTGGFIGIEAQTSITLSAGGSIQANGGNGTGGILSPSATANTLVGGGGGGGGGVIILSSPTVTNNSTITANGGVNGATSTNSASPTNFLVSPAGSSFGGVGGFTEVGSGINNSTPSTNGILVTNKVISTL